MKLLLVSLVAVFSTTIGVTCSVLFLWRFVGFSGEGELVLGAIVTLAAGIAGMVVVIRAANIHLNRADPV